jgi:hypothetical protein
MGKKNKISPELKELLKVEPTDAVFKIAPEGKITAFMPATTATEFQKKMFFIVSSFLRQLTDNPAKVLKDRGEVDISSIMSEVLEQAKKMHSLASFMDESDEEDTDVDTEARKKKYQ